jgi:anti-sigma regulatory factor (Ser/Thr protein kinase)
MNLTAPPVAATVQAEQVQLRLPSRLELIEPMADYLMHRAVQCGSCPPTHARRLAMALYEALSNAVIHGNLEVPSELKQRGERAFAEALATRAADPSFASRTVDILVDYDGDRCRWVLTDQGPGFDVERVFHRNGTDDTALTRPCGRGIIMMCALLDEVAYEAGGRRVILTLHYSLADKRRQPRLPVQHPLHIVPVRPDGSIDWDAACQGISRNLSRDGVAILQTRLASADRVLIGIVSGGQPLYVPAEVRHCRRLGEDLFELGCRFQTTPLP